MQHLPLDGRVLHRVWLNAHGNQSAGKRLSQFAADLNFPFSCATICAKKRAIQNSGAVPQKGRGRSKRCFCRGQMRYVPHDLSGH